MPEYEVTYIADGYTSYMHRTKPSITSVIDSVLDSEYGNIGNKIISIELNLLEDKCQKK